MKQIRIFLKTFIIFGFLLTANLSVAQLGFCTGNSGDPIFIETFGSGTTQGPALPTGTTSYTFTSGSPNDGFYTVSSTTSFFDWHNVGDHTGDTNGKCLVVNADFTAGEFYRTTISGLCENTSYEFSAFLINLLPASGCGGSGIPINVGFEIWDDTDTTLLASGDTGSINGTSSPNWEQYGLVFQTLPSQTSIILKMRNNGVGGCGNDLAIDDIVFKSCGDNVVVQDNANQDQLYICDTDTPYNLTLQANPDNSIYNTHAYQWEMCLDATTWSPITGENNQTLNTTVTQSSFYRVKVAEDAINLANNLCNVISDVFFVEVISTPNNAVSNGDVTVCEDEELPLEVTVPVGVTVNWYDAAIGGNLLQENSTTFLPLQEGTYYAQAISINGDCQSVNRTPVTITYASQPLVNDEVIYFCQNESIILSANIDNMMYSWSTGESTKEITTSSPGNFTVVVTNSQGCSSIRTIEVIEINPPLITNVFSDENDLIVETLYNGNFSYSIDGINYQNSPVFQNLEGGRYTIYVRENSNCGIDTKTFIHFVIPKYFTPNNDTFNDTWSLKGIEFYASSEVQIFDRYGKLLFYRKNKPVAWNGTFNKKLLPTSDYWYIITIESQKMVGHFTLKR